MYISSEITLNTNPQLKLDNFIGKVSNWPTEIFSKKFYLIFKFNFFHREPSMDISGLELKIIKFFF